MRIFLSENGMDFFNLILISKHVNYKTAHVAIFNSLLFLFLNFMVNRRM